METLKRPPSWGVSGLRIADAIPGIFSRTDIGEQDPLETGTHPSLGLVGTGFGIDFDHGGHIEQFDRPAEIIQGKQVERRVFRQELDIIEHAGMAEGFDRGGPDAVEAGAEAGLVGLQ